MLHLLFSKREMIQNSEHNYFGKRPRLMKLRLRIEGFKREQDHFSGVVEWTKGEHYVCDHARCQSVVANFTM